MPGYKQWSGLLDGGNSGRTTKGIHRKPASCPTELPAQDPALLQSRISPSQVLGERPSAWALFGSGSGAGDGFDGVSVVQTHMTNSRLTDPEVLEWRFPVLLQ